MATRKKIPLIPSDSTLTIGATKTLSTSVNVDVSGADVTIVGSGAAVISFPTTTATLMTLGLVESVTGAKTFDKDKILMKGTSTGVTTISTAVIDGSNFTQTLQAATGTIALTSDIPSITGLVPYTGATTDVNLGTYKLNGLRILADATKKTIFLGVDAGLNRVHASDTSLIAIGTNAMKGVAGNWAPYNIAIGEDALLSIDTGTYNIALGYGAGRLLAGGGSNVILGAAGRAMTTANNCIAIGATALDANIGAADNVAIGYKALFAATGERNTAVGSQSNYRGTTGTENTTIGYTAGGNVNAGTKNTLIGAWAGLRDDLDSCVAIGYKANYYSLESNTFFIDNQDRTSAALEKTSSLMYGVFNATPGSQTLSLNAQVTATYGVNIPTGQTYKVNSVPLVSALTISAITADQAITVNNGYLANKGTLLTLSLPAVSVVGDKFRVTGMNAGLWSISQAASQYIKFGISATTIGVTGSLSSVNTYDSVELVCIEANLGWVVVSSIGNLTIA